jgi:hypothetical protein
MRMNQISVDDDKYRCAGNSCIHLARLPVVFKTPGHTADQTVASIGRLQQGAPPSELPCR